MAVDVCMVTRILLERQGGHAEAVLPQVQGHTRLQILDTRQAQAEREVGMLGKAPNNLCLPIHYTGGMVLRRMSISGKAQPQWL